MKFNLHSLLIVLALLAKPLLAMELTVEQAVQQGAMLSGKTDAEKLIVLGREIPVAEDGHFVFGVGRDAEPVLTIQLIAKSGETVSKELKVQQRVYDIQRIEGVAQKYVSPPEEVLDRIRSDAAAVRAARESPGSARQDYRQGFIWPAEGRISGVYGSQRVFNGVPKRPHFGLDIAAPVGTPVIAPASGVVSLAHADMYYSGGTLILDHGAGISSTFIHLSRILVEHGQEVEQGQVIAEIGATGRVTGPHLDWRINWFDQRLDPQLLVAPRD